MQDRVRGQIVQLGAVHEKQPPNKLRQRERQPPDDVVEEDDPLAAPGARDDFLAGAVPILLVHRKLPLFLQGLEVLGGDGGLLPSTFLLLERGDAGDGAGGLPHDLWEGSFLPMLAEVAYGAQARAMNNGGRGCARRKKKASERGEVPWRPFSFSFYTAAESIWAVDHASLPRGQHLGYHVAAGYQPVLHCLLRSRGNRGGTTVRSDIRVHGAVTPRSKAGSGPC